MNSIKTLKIRQLSDKSKIDSKPKVSEMIRERVKQINNGLELHGPPPLPPLTSMSKKRPILNDSDDDNLYIDFNDDSNPSISDSNDSFDAKDDEIDGKDSSERRDKREDVKKWWSKNFDQKMGNCSKIDEICLSDDDNESYEVIKPKLKPKLKTKLKTPQLYKQLTKSRIDDKLSIEFLNKPNPIQKETFVQLNQRFKSMDNSLRRIEFQKYKDSVKKSVEDIYLWDQIPGKSGLKSNVKSSEKSNNSQTTIVTKVGKPTEKYFCFFCDQILSSPEETKSHYLCHLGVFLECGECHLKFGSLESYRNHNSNHISSDKMLNLKDWNISKKWSDNYLEYIENEDQILKVYSPTNKMFCPVCQKIKQLYGNCGTNCRQFEKSLKLSKIKINEEYVRNHLHQHLQYLPYECIDCSFDEKKTEFCLNSTARQHLKEVHNIENAFDLRPNELKPYFELKKSIKRLDFLIEVCLSVSLKMIVYWNTKSHKRSQIFVANQK